MTLENRHWRNVGPSPASATAALEAGKILFFPYLAFSLSAGEQALLDPRLVDPKRKNISFHPAPGRLTGVAVPERQAEIRALLERYYRHCLQLLEHVLPDYRHAVREPVGTLRLHPIAAWGAKASWRKDDSRLHVDAFPSRPTHGARILRVFTNINPNGEHRAWRVGEPFPSLARRYLPRLGRYSPFSSWLQQVIGITKTRRSRYDHVMLKLHDAMKADEDYQQHGPQLALNLPPGSSWICFSDQTPHAAMGGQFMLEQTFILPVAAMRAPEHAPINVLASLLNKPLLSRD
ncbi:3-deoxy-D-manno-oct-2-ulosonic acid (Kdo) hydroxylase [Martelella alba]|uniref:3-deoxy-D-manno-oct-2-ulosonic acid (Kdo) hydroxylase n=2 Tax=Martelella alba TaxID=2590451 RepID=A0ABY2SJA0_9HYPH|nr:3-deoxy-D-manno-oct-2-ulosonic acid (Kdo) hydroxylase [Martelella alba]